jgi:hypothetical protein
MYWKGFGRRKYFSGILLEGLENPYKRVTVCGARLSFQPNISQIWV